MKVSCKSWFQNEHHTSVAKSVIRQIMESSLYGTQHMVHITKFTVISRSWARCCLKQRVIKKYFHAIFHWFSQCLVFSQKRRFSVARVYLWTFVGPPICLLRSNAHREKRPDWFSVTFAETFLTRKAQQAFLVNALYMLMASTALNSH